MVQGAEAEISAIARNARRELKAMPRRWQSTWLPKDQDGRLHRSRADPRVRRSARKGRQVMAAVASRYARALVDVVLDRRLMPKRPPAVAARSSCRGGKR